jgi:hypothetical protein
MAYSLVLHPQRVPFPNATPQYSTPGRAAYRLIFTQATRANATASAGFPVIILLFYLFFFGLLVDGLVSSITELGRVQTPADDYTILRRRSFGRLQLSCCGAGKQVRFFSPSQLCFIHQDLVLMGMLRRLRPY